MLLLAYILQEIMGTRPLVVVTLIPLMIITAGASIAGGLSLSKTGKYKVLCLIALALLSLGAYLLSGLKAASPVWLLIADGSVERRSRSSPARAYDNHSKSGVRRDNGCGHRHDPVFPLSGWHHGHWADEGASALPY